MDWKEAYLTRLEEFVAKLESDISYLRERRTQILIDGEDVTTEWIDRYAEEADRLRALLDAARQVR